VGFALKLGSDNLLEFSRVHGKSADGFRHFFRGHWILIHLETEALLVEADALATLVNCLSWLS
jgi:hypothetical protein